MKRLLVELTMIVLVSLLVSACKPATSMVTAIPPTISTATPTKAVIEPTPQDALAYYNRGVARHEQGDLDAAIQDYTKAIALNPQHTWAYNNRGVARSDQGDLDAAIEDYTTAIKLNPQDAGAYVNRGLARHSQGDLASAIADFHRYLELTPDASGRQQVEEWIAELEKQLSNP
jgi:tetratricopeptide (TPR) repeat protein